MIAKCREKWHANCYCFYTRFVSWICIIWFICTSIPYSFLIINYLTLVSNLIFLLPDTLCRVWKLKTFTFPIHGTQYILISIYRKVFHFSKIPESPPLSKHALPRPLKSNKAFMWFNLNSRSPLFQVLCCLVLGMCQIKWAIFKKEILCLILKLIFL